MRVEFFNLLSDNDFFNNLLRRIPEQRIFSGLVKIEMLRIMPADKPFMLPQHYQWILSAIELSISEQ